MTAPFRLANVPGVTPDKWVRLWRERHPDDPLELVQSAAADAAALLRERAVDAALLRAPRDRAGLHAIPLYTETTIVVAARDHLIAASDELTPADLADEVLLLPQDDVIAWDDPPARVAEHRPETTEDAVRLAAGGLGILIVPQSLFRMHYRKDLISRPIPGAPQSTVALAWLEDETTDAIERFIGIVRGRTPNSTRGRQPEPEPRRAAPAPRRRPSATRAASPKPRRRR